MLTSEIGRHGELRLRFVQRQNKTTLVENYSRPPLQVMRAIPGGSGSLCIYLLSPTGGVVQGDFYNMALELDAQTHVLFTTTSATRVYKMPIGQAEQHIQVTIQQGAILEFVPDATILYAGADFKQTMEVTLQPGALLILHDLVMPGRLAQGEFLQFRRYSNRLIVRDVAGLLLYDSVHLEPAAINLQQAGILEGFTCWGSFYVLGDITRWQFDMDSLYQTYTGSSLTDDTLSAASLLSRNGFCVRILGNRLESIYAHFAELRLNLRVCLGLSGETLRK